ncbi:MAG: hypothetical protein MK085_07305, partial [Phycisphaerales bacterium]|nr:hypothetical protein [Phycisphaerales bacterium]
MSTLLCLPGFQSGAEFRRLVLGALACVLAMSTHALADWELVFEDDFTSRGDPLSGWRTFGDAMATKGGRKGNALELQGPGGALPAYSGAVLALGGGIKPNEIVVARARYRATSKVREESGYLAFKLEFFNREGKAIGTEEATAPLHADAARRWNSIEVAARVPAGTDRTDLAIVLVQAGAEPPCGVLVDEVEAERRQPPTDFLDGAGGFEASDGGAVGWTAFNNVAATPVADGQAIKTWGAYNEPYAGSGLKRLVPMPSLESGEEIRATVRTTSPRGDSIEGTRNFAVLRLECVDGKGQAIAHKESRPLDPEKTPMTTGAWNTTEMTMRPPPGTVAVRYILAFIQPTTEAGAILFDQASLVRSSSPQTEMLANGDFETASTGIPGWRSTGDVVVAGEHRRGGTSAVRMRTRPDQSEAGIERAVPGVSGGDSIRVEAWTLVPSAASIKSSDGAAMVKLDYLDRNGRLKDTVNMPLVQGNAVVT